MSRSPRRPARAVLVTLLAGALLVGLPGTATSDGTVGPAPDPADGVAVTGFALGGSAKVAVARDADALTTLTTVGTSLRPGGRGLVPPDADTLDGVRLAHRHGLRAELLLTSYSDRLGDFDPRAAHRLLSSPDARGRVARQLARSVVSGGWDGVNIDIERVQARDARGLVAFVRAVQAALPDDRTVSIDVSASTTLRGYRQRGYRMAGLGRAADVVVVMAYDQHGPTWSGPGPVGDLRWQREAMLAALDVVPAQKLDLGVAGYGYTWPRRGTGRSVGVARARELVARDGVRPRWHRDAGEWSARLDDGTVVWWSDGRSYRARLRLASRLDLHGVAVWRLGLADPLG